MEVTRIVTVEITGIGRGDEAYYVPDSRNLRECIAEHIKSCTLADSVVVTNIQDFITEDK